MEYVEPPSAVRLPLSAALTFTCTTLAASGIKPQTEPDEFSSSVPLVPTSSPGRLTDCE